VRCTFHPDATASTLCARCGRALCTPCAAREDAARVCAAGCAARPVPSGPDRAAAELSIRLSRWARWARIGATYFLVGIGAASLHAAALGLFGYAVSVFCLSVAWHRHRHPNRYSRWSR